MYFYTTVNCVQVDIYMNGKILALQEAHSSKVGKGPSNNTVFNEQRINQLILPKDIGQATLRE